MNSLNVFRVIRAVPTCFAESVSTLSANIALHVAVPCSACSVLPVSFASAERAFNGGQCLQLSFALPFHKQHGFLRCSFSVRLCHWLIRLNIENLQCSYHVGYKRSHLLLGLAILWFRVQQRFLGLLVCSDRERGLCTGCRLLNLLGWLGP